MAQKVNVVVTDDFDGTEGASTVRFGLDGTEYEVDLSPEHAEQLRGFLNAYVGVGRKITGRKTTTVRAKTSKSEVGKIRVWARENGYALGERGRVPANIVDAYHAAKGGPVATVEPVPAAEFVETDVSA